MNKQNPLFLFGISLVLILAVLSLLLAVETDGFVNGFNSQTGIVRDGGLVPLSYTGDITCENYYCSYRREINTSGGIVTESWTTLDERSEIRANLSSSAGVPTYTLYYAFSSLGWTPWGSSSTPCKNCVFFPGDYNGDGVSDLIGFSNEEKKGYFVLSSDWSSWYTWGIPDCLTSNCSLIPITGDFDKDKKSDLVAYDALSGDISFLLSSQGYSTWNNVQTPCKNCSFISGDYNGDGVSDFIGYAPQACWASCSNKGQGEDDGCGGVCGVLPYIDYSGSKLNIYPMDNSAGVSWGCSGTSIGTSATDGFGNTAAIVNSCSTAAASKLCSDLNFGGYSDWYLPAKDQLSAMYAQRNNVVKLNYAAQWVNFTASNYWSSTEVLDSPENFAHGINFAGGSVGISNKDSNFRVRCVRDDINGNVDDVINQTDFTNVLYYAFSPFINGWNYVPMPFCTDCVFFPGDYGGDGISDFLGLDVANEMMYYLDLTSGSGWVNFPVSLCSGSSGSDEKNCNILPVSGDFNRDKRTDILAYTPLSGNGFFTVSTPDGGWSPLSEFNTPCKNCTPIPGDYEGDKVSDLMFYYSTPLPSPEIYLNLDITYPLNTAYTTAITNMNYVVSSSSSLQSCWYSTNNGITNTTTACGTDIIGLSSIEGSNTWKVYAGDITGNLNSSSVTFSVDSCTPNLLNTSLSSWINQTCSGTQRNQSRFKIQYDTNSCGEILNQTFYESQLVGPILQNMTWTSWTNVSCLFGDKMNQTSSLIQYDVFGCVSNITSFRYQAIEYCSFDAIFPLINTVYPQNINYTTIITSMNYTVSDTNLQACWYFNGTANNTIACGTNITTNLRSNEGSNTWIVYANDTLGNLNSSSVNFFVESVSFTNPTESSQTTLTTRNDILINVTSRDTNLASITIRLYNSTGLMNSTNHSTSPYFINFTNLIDGIYYFNATACDTLNNCANTETRTVTIYASSVDTTSPSIAFVSPTDDSSTLNRTFIRVNVTASDSGSGLKNITIYLYNSTKNIVNTNLLSTSPFYVEFSGLINGGTYYFNATACDTLNNCARTLTKTVIINTSFVDRVVPSVTLTEPENNEEDHTSETIFRYNVSDLSNIVLCTLTLRSNISQSDTNNWIVKFTEQSFTKDLVIGNYTWNITCTDSFGNSATSETRNLFRTTIDCGDEICDDGETCSSCSHDCNSCSGSYCGDETCDDDETSRTCERDCGSSVSGGYAIFIVSDATNLAIGYTKFLAPKQSLKFKIGGEYHIVEIVSIGVNSIIVKVQSEPQTRTILLGTEEKFELTMDDYYDLSVRLNSITANSNPMLKKASITIKTINEKIPPVSVTCTPNWKCDWSDCIEGKQTNLCSDANNCGKQDGKPATEERECNSGWTQEQYLIFLGFLIGFVIILAVLIFIVWWFVKGGNKTIDNLKKAKDFVSSARKRGYKDSEIRGMFVKKGWKNSDVDKVL